MDFADVPIGIPSLWSGLSASIFRQMTYSSARFGLYNILSEEIKKSTGQEKLSMPMTIACAGVSGGLAGLVGNPAEVRLPHMALSSIRLTLCSKIVLVRMCADGAKSAGERFAYSNAAHGMYRVWRDEGITTFTRGATANVARSVLMSELCQPLICKTKLTLRADVGQIAT